MVAFASHLTRVLYAGVDPKSIVCEFFRHGQCTKGFKCKFSHDLAVERKTAKIDLFTDQRDVADGDEEGMEDWDQETLEKVTARVMLRTPTGMPVTELCFEAALNTSATCSPLVEHITSYITLIILTFPHIHHAHQWSVPGGCLHAMITCCLLHRAAGGQREAWQ